MAQANIQLQTQWYALASACANNIWKSFDQKALARKVRSGPNLRNWKYHHSRWKIWDADSPDKSCRTSRLCSPVDWYWTPADGFKQQLATKSSFYKFCGGHPCPLPLLYSMVGPISTGTSVYRFQRYMNAWVQLALATPVQSLLLAGSLSRQLLRLKKIAVPIWMCWWRWEPQPPFLQCVGWPSDMVWWGSTWWLVILETSRNWITCWFY